MQTAAEVLQLRAPENDVGSGAAVLDELRAVRALLTSIEHRLLGERAAPETPRASGAALYDDAVVDQRSAPVPKDLYLRLARRGAFRSRKIGKRVVARWADVRAAFLGNRAASLPAAPHGDPPSDADGLNGIRRQLGLATKGK